MTSSVFSQLYANMFHIQITQTEVDFLVNPFKYYNFLGIPSATDDKRVMAISQIMIHLGYVCVRPENLSFSYVGKTTKSIFEDKGLTVPKKCR